MSDTNNQKEHHQPRKTWGRDFGQQQQTSDPSLKKQTTAASTTEPHCSNTVPSTPTFSKLLTLSGIRVHGISGATQSAKSLALETLKKLAPKSITVETASFDTPIKRLLCAIVGYSCIEGKRLTMDILNTEAGKGFQLLLKQDYEKIPLENVIHALFRGDRVDDLKLDRFCVDLLATQTYRHEYTKDSKKTNLAVISSGIKTAIDVFYKLWDPHFGRYAKNVNALGIGEVPDDLDSQIANSMIIDQETGIISLPSGNNYTSYTAGRALHVLGTECFKKLVHESFWIMIQELSIAYRFGGQLVKNLSDHGFIFKLNVNDIIKQKHIVVVYDNLEYLNELIFIKRIFDGAVIRINRPERTYTEASSTAEGNPIKFFNSPSQLFHVGENLINKVNATLTNETPGFDAIVYNIGTEDYFVKQITEVVEKSGVLDPGCLYDNSDKMAFDLLVSQFVGIGGSISGSNNGCSVS